MFRPVKIIPTDSRTATDRQSALRRVQYIQSARRVTSRTTFSVTIEKSGGAHRSCAQTRAGAAQVAGGISSHQPHRAECAKICGKKAGRQTKRVGRSFFQRACLSKNRPSTGRLGSFCGCSRARRTRPGQHLSDSMTGQEQNVFLRSSILWQRCCAATSDRRHRRQKVR